MKARLAVLAIAAALLAYATPAKAVDFFGYFRDSIAGNSKGGGQACFQTPGQDYKLRLANECDNYGEWGLQQSVYKDKNGVEFTAGVMFAYDQSPATANLNAPTAFGIQQNYVKAKIPQWAGAQFWGGRQYYRRENIDMIDFFYLNTSEPGVGVEDVDLGFGKLAVSVFQTHFGTDVKRVAWRPDARIYGIPVNPDGTLEIDVNVVATSKNTGVGALGTNDGTAGVWATVEHTQNNLMGGFNKLAVQFANGPAAQMGPGTPSFAPPGVTGSTEVLNKDNQQIRALDQLLLQPSATFQVLVGAMYQHKQFGSAAGKIKLDSIGVFGRPVYYVNDYFKLQGDIGWTQTKPSGVSAASLIKATFAPTITPAPGEGGGFFVRPEIRFFVTYASWNNQANTAFGTTTGAVGQGLFGTDKNGVTFGSSVETWF